MELLKLPLALAAVLSVVRIVHFFRARSMRAFAARRGFQYLGPTAPPKWWWNPSHLEIHTPLPGWISRFSPNGQRIRQVWNVIEGKENGISILIFDCIIGGYKGGNPCTLIACHTEQNPFGNVAAVDRVEQAHGWTILHGVWFLWFSWTMGTKWLDGHLCKLQTE
jgi:hypothetical protein